MAIRMARFTVQQDQTRSSHNIDVTSVAPVAVNKHSPSRLTYGVFDSVSSHLYTSHGVGHGDL